ncbi:alanine or glycine:cation symporter, AGCS family [Blastococcus sp. DSM 46786]|uniref:alanine/glycine:cation symporter family protein n=1 Tax=Blastococcus sp. DSM 46786 TaxID=1798227 RepID=UPI0008B4D4DC|nr:alanine/glycine:cation symporter family protein [Blastococcus sp. DSM 46786]SEL54842.1 alanine or glycine:cation symporter, AGCS family [Blastococcus sp. DSM 46786]
MPSDSVLAASFDEQVDGFFAPVFDWITAVVFYAVPLDFIDEGVELPLIVVWLVIAGFFFTVYLRGFQFRAFRHAIELIRGRYDDPRDAGEVTHFQALATAVSGTVGLGNIAGVAIAISLGGPGATLWMIIAGLLGMCTKGVECTLGVKYRNVYPDGRVSGGPMYYLTKGLREKNPRLGTLGKVLAVLFCIFTLGGAVGGGNMFQANQAFNQAQSVTGGDDGLLGFGAAGAVFGFVLALLVGAVIIGGIRSIARVTDKLVPFMAVFYVLACLTVLLANFSDIPAALWAIVSQAFSPEAGFGGIVGVLIQGFRRAAFSNEAGLGSAAIAHSAVKTEHPATEGHVAVLEPFIDTVVICTMTALAIVITGTYADEASDAGVETTSAAFETVVGWFPIVLAVAVILFAYSTMLAWSYYGLKAATYLFGESMVVDRTWKLVFCLFVIIGASSTVESVIGFSDSMIFLMSLPNIIGLYILARVVKRELNGYRARIDSGEILPVAERT